MEKALDFSPLPRNDLAKLSTIKMTLAGKAAPVVERATKLKEAVKVAMRWFEEGWLFCRW